MTQATSNAPSATQPHLQYQFLRAGLTGGIAAGKSTVLTILRQLGAYTIDTDILAHAALAKGTKVWSAVVKAFGREILNPDETINRARLGEIVFADAAKREKLNQLIHPTIRRDWLGQIDAQRQKNFRGVIVVAVPLLFEVKAEEHFDVIIVVACTEKTQIQRLQLRGLSATQARQRIAAQMPLNEKMGRGDFVIWNEPPLPILHRQVALIWNELCQMNAEMTTKR